MNQPIDPTTADTTPRMRVRKIAEQYDITEGTVRRWVREGKLQGVHVGRSLYITTASVEALFSEADQ